MELIAQNGRVLLFFLSALLLAVEMHQTVLFLPQDHGMVTRLPYPSMRIHRRLFGVMMGFGARKTWPEGYFVKLDWCKVHKSTYRGIFRRSTS